MVVTILGIVPITRRAPEAPGDAARSSRTGLLLAAVATVAYGLLVVSLDKGGKGDPYWAVSAMRLTSVIAIALIVRAGRLKVAPRAGGLPVLVFIGALLVVANVLFTTATTIGYLSVVAVLGWLSPAVVIS